MKKTITIIVLGVALSTLTVTPVNAGPVARFVKKLVHRSAGAKQVGQTGSVGTCPNGACQSR